MSLLDRLFAPPPPKKTPIEKLTAMVETGHNMEAIHFAKEAHLGHELALLLIERMHALPPAERAPLRPLIAAAFWDDERPMTPTQALTAARFYLDRNDAAGAATAVQHILRHDENHVEALYFRALAMIRQNRFNDAVSILRNILSIDPEHREAKRAEATMARLSRFHPPALVGESRPLLVGVGGDAGEIVRMTPLLRVLAEAIGQPVDVMLTIEVDDDRYALLKRDGVTKDVIWFAKSAFRQRYERILLTESFGDLHPLFSTDQTLSAKAWDMYRPDSGVDETRHAIDVAADLLGFDRPVAVPAPFVGNLPEQPEGAGSNRIALLPQPISGLNTDTVTVDWPSLAEALRARGLVPVVLGVGEVAAVGDAELRPVPTLEALAGELRTFAAAVTGVSDAATLAHALGLPLVSLAAVPIAPMRADAPIESVAGADSPVTTIADTVARLAR